MYISVNYFFQRALRFKNVFHGITRRAMATAGRCFVMRHRLHLRARIRHRNRQSAPPHDRQINHIVSHISDLFFVKAALCQDLVQNVGFILRALMEIVEAWPAR